MHDRRIPSISASTLPTVGLMRTRDAAMTVSAIVCAFADRRWPDLVAAVASLRAQSCPVDEVVVVIDHNPALLERAKRELAGARTVANQHARGLSGARNTGIETATSDILVFLDDDAVAERGWLEALLARYRDPRVIAVGGAVLPRWEDGRPPGFPEEFDWVVGCSYRGMPVAAGAVRNPIGASMSFRREVFEAVGGFADGIGRVGGRPVGCEETELCIRAGKTLGDVRILYEPEARVYHRVPAARASWRYFASRCFNEGISKALVAQRTGVSRGLSAERSYTLRTLPRAVVRGLADGLAGEPAGLVRAIAVVVGLALTTLGFVTASAQRRLTARWPG
jgi:GT2 family glycosyltransferase